MGKARRVSECIVCGKSNCVEFEDKFYCFRFGVTRKKSMGNYSQKRGKANRSLGVGGLGGETFSKGSPTIAGKSNNQTHFDFV